MRIVSSGLRQSERIAFLEHIGIPFLGLLGCVLFTSEFFGHFSRVSDAFGESAAITCGVDGNVIFPWTETPLFYWNPGQFLSITLGAGDLTFTQAKIIDVIWDFVVGRGGQLLLTLLAYPVMRKSLLTSLERKRIRMPLIAALTFHHGTIEAWWQVFRDLTRRWSWKLLGYLYIVLYLLAFGTIVSAMTGYQAKSQPFYKQEGTENLMSYSEVTLTTEAVAIVDGARVGLESNTVIVNMESDPNRALYFYSVLTGYFCSSRLASSNDTNGTLTWTNFTETAYGSYVTNLRSWGGYQQQDYSNKSRLPSAASTSFGVDWLENETSSPYGTSDVYSASQSLLQCTTSNLTLGDQDFILKEPVLSFQFYTGANSSAGSGWVCLDQNGKILNEVWLEEDGVSVCQPLGRYVWGFSSLLLFTLCIATIVYVCILWALHIDVWWNSRADRLKQNFSLYRDIMDFADGLREELGEKAEKWWPKILTKQSNPTRAECNCLSANARVQERKLGDPRQYQRSDVLLRN